MSLFEDSLSPRTRFDLNFRIGDIPVRVHPYFWLTSVLMGLNAEKFSYVAAWVVLVFISILVHELGHVLMGRYFGNRGHIVLTGLCGLAVGSSNLPERWQRNLVYLAGPGAGFLFAAVIVGLYSLFVNPSLPLFMIGELFYLPPMGSADLVIPSPFVMFLLFNFLRINIYWGLVNLLPIWPLDGGQVCREICQTFRGSAGMRLSLQVSVLTAIVVAVLFLVELFMRKSGANARMDLFPVLLFGMLAYNSWQMLQFVQQAGPDWEEQESEPRAAWERDPDWWKGGDNSWR